MFVRPQKEGACCWVTLYVHNAVALDIDALNSYVRLEC